MVECPRIVSQNALASCKDFAQPGLGSQSTPSRVQVHRQNRPSSHQFHGGANLSLQLAHSFFQGWQLQVLARNDICVAVGANPHESSLSGNGQRSDQGRRFACNSDRTQPHIPLRRLFTKRMLNQVEMPHKTIMHSVQMDLLLKELELKNEGVYKMICLQGQPQGRLIRSVGIQLGCKSQLVQEILRYLIQVQTDPCAISKEPCAAAERDPIQENQPQDRITKPKVDWSLAQTLLEDL